MDMHPRNDKYTHKMEHEDEDFCENEIFQL